MAQRFTIKDIARQAGLGLATVDRVLHGRAHVRAVTRDRVQAALAELDRQYAASLLDGPRLTLDIVMQAPDRFTSAVRTAFEAELPLMRPAALRARFHLEERMDDRRLALRLRAILRRGTQGVVLKAPATPLIAACLADLRAARVPVVTYVTDVPAGLRLAYVGMPNHQAGATAAYLMARMAPPAPAGVLVTLSSQMFQGEEARREGFAAWMATHAPHLTLVTVSEGYGVDRTTEALVDRALADHPALAHVYSIGGGNRAVLRAFARAGRQVDVFAAHDLDADNRALLDQGRLSFVIHHAFRQDARQIALHFAKVWRLVDPALVIDPTEIQIACPVVAG